MTSIGAFFLGLVVGVLVLAPALLFWLEELSMANKISLKRIG